MYDHLLYILLAYGFTFIVFLYLQYLPYYSYRILHAKLLQAARLKQEQFIKNSSNES